MSTQPSPDAPAAPSSRKDGEKENLVILFTDMVGSTELQGKNADADYLLLIEKHDAVFREVFGNESGGRKIIKNTGDGFLAVFPQPEDAVAFALRFQKALREKDVGIEASVGLHLGTISWRNKGTEVCGLDVSTASRVLSLATGGRILMTEVAFINARRNLEKLLKPDEWNTLQDKLYQEYESKGIVHPFKVGQIGYDGEDGVSFEAPLGNEKVSSIEEQKRKDDDLRDAAETRRWRYIINCIAVAVFVIAALLSFIVFSAQKTELASARRRESEMEAKLARTEAEARESRAEVGQLRATLETERAAALGMVDLVSGELSGEFIKTGRDDLLEKGNARLLVWFPTQKPDKLPLASLNTWQRVAKSQIDFFFAHSEDEAALPAFDSVRALAMEVIRRKPQRDEMNLVELDQLCLEHADLLKSKDLHSDSFDEKWVSIQLEFLLLDGNEAASKQEWGSFIQDGSAVRNSYIVSLKKEPPRELIALLNQAKERFNKALKPMASSNTGDEYDYNDYNNYTPRSNVEAYTSYDTTPSYDYTSFDTTPVFFDTLIKELREVLAKNPGSKADEVILCLALQDRRDARLTSGQADKAIEDAREVSNLRETLAIKSKWATKEEWGFALARLSLGKCYLQGRQFADALTTTHEACEKFTALHSRRSKLEETRVEKTGTPEPASAASVSGTFDAAAYFQRFPAGFEQWMATAQLQLAEIHLGMGSGGNPETVRECLDEAQSLWPPPRAQKTPSQAYLDFADTLARLRRAIAPKPAEPAKATMPVKAASQK